MHKRVSGPADSQLLTVGVCTGILTNMVRFSLLEFVTDWELKVVAQDLWSFKAADAPVPICMRAVGILEGG